MVISQSDEAMSVASQAMLVKAQPLTLIEWTSFNWSRRRPYWHSLDLFSSAPMAFSHDGLTGTEPPFYFHKAQQRVRVQLMQQILAATPQGH